MTRCPITPKDGVLYITDTHLPLCTFLHLMRQGFHYKNLKTMFPQYDTKVFVDAMKHYLKHAEYLRPQLSRDEQNSKVVRLTKRTLDDAWVWQLARWDAEQEMREILDAMTDKPGRYSWWST